MSRSIQNRGNERRSPVIFMQATNCRCVASPPPSITSETHSSISQRRASTRGQAARPPSACALSCTQMGQPVPKDSGNGRSRARYRLFSSLPLHAQPTSFKCCPIRAPSFFCLQQVARVGRCSGAGTRQASGGACYALCSPLHYLCCCFICAHCAYVKTVL